MAFRVRVCSLDEVAPGESRGFQVPGVTLPIMVTNLDGEYLANASMCPHEDVSLLGCKRRGATVFCRGHGYRFDLRSGACSHDAKLTLRRYRSTVIDGALYVDLV
ncbi:Rieske (2Fe-2S) protein [Haliangium ochraceum]|uniref:Rieske (2Fe-2S) iron-sulphur domain protein n=1 Tax=Haliangium ochraceum (strain DSM 14365 / JCM 11303 / SMP-2) TaxID=502025 RepID=D0LZL2_HALO1|nr:Rieske 2Fe-2S domain-containing protein [Haliangium ochraceum]ACY17991.1 Rieske (2Fe-2S) iron-sulphur domain protein [Haliangium ochraceum DSM 14365]